MNSQGKSVGPYEVFAYLPGYGWEQFVDGTWTKLRGEGGVVEDAKELLHAGYRVAMIVDSDGHATHMEYWGLAQPRTMKLVAGTYDFIEAQSVLFEARKEIAMVGEERQQALMKLMDADRSLTAALSMAVDSEEMMNGIHMVLLRGEDDEPVKVMAAHGDRWMAIPYDDELLELVAGVAPFRVDGENVRSMNSAADGITKVAGKIVALMVGGE